MERGPGEQALLGLRYVCWQWERFREAWEAGDSAWREMVGRCLECTPTVLSSSLGLWHLQATRKRVHRAKAARAYVGATTALRGTVLLLCHSTGRDGARDPSFLQEREGRG